MHELDYEFAKHPWVLAEAGEGSEQGLDQDVLKAVVNRELLVNQAAQTIANFGHGFELVSLIQEEFRAAHEKVLKLKEEKGIPPS